MRIRPPMIRGHLTRDLERWLAPPNFSRFDAHSPKTGRLLARCDETGFKVSRPRHLVSGGARLLKASESSVPPDCNASWPGRKLILKILPHGDHQPVRQDPIVRLPIGAATFCLEDSRRRKTKDRKLLIRMEERRVTGRDGLRKLPVSLGSFRRWDCGGKAKAQRRASPPPTVAWINGFTPEACAQFGNDLYWWR